MEISRSENQREVELGRSHHIKEKAEQSLGALLADLVGCVIVIAISYTVRSP